MIDYHEIALSVLELAVTLDRRMDAPDDVVQMEARLNAWTRVLSGRTWPDEAKQAVIDHYQTNRRPLMPADIIDHCAKQPVWSSLDHARDWILRRAVEAPYSGAIEEYTGIPEPVIEIPSQIATQGHEARRIYLTEQLTAWAEPLLDELAQAIVNRKHTPWWQHNTDTDQ